jgi:hypothetical protein
VAVQQNSGEQRLLGPGQLQALCHALLNDDPALVVEVYW